MIPVKLYMLDYTLAYFHKDSVTSCNKNRRLEKIVIKKIVITERGHEN